MENYQLIIIGAGPAGLTAAIYAKRAMLKTLIIEKGSSGGKLNKTSWIENYPAFAKIRGPELAKKITEQVRGYEIDWKKEEAIQLKFEVNNFEIKTENQTYFSKAVIIASGTIENKLNIPGEKEFTNLGVSYCAICDGFLFKGKVVAVVGGGYSACEAALYLSNIVEKVYLIHRRDEFKVDEEIMLQLKNNFRITMILNANLIEIKGKVDLKVGKRINSIKLEIKGDLEEIEISALFPCVGLIPYTNFLHELEIASEKNHILVDEKNSTKIPGLFAAGDVTKPKRIKQIVTAIADGAIAAQSAINYLRKKL